MKQVKKFIEEKGFIPASVVETEVNWFYDNLGIDDSYFKIETVENVANNILSLYGAKIVAYTKKNKTLEIELEQKSENGCVFIHSSRPGVSQSSGPQYEKKIDEEYLDNMSAPYRLETYRSKGTVSMSHPTQLRCYFVSKCEFVNPNPGENATDLNVISNKAFLEKATESTRSIYQRMMEIAVKRTGPVIEVFEYQKTHEKRVVIVYKRGGTQKFFSALSDLYHFYDLFSTRKYVEQFSNGYTIISLYLKPAGNVQAPPLETSIQQIMREASMLYCLPSTPFHPLFRTGQLSVQETTYAYATWIFCQHFLNRLGPEYSLLAGFLDKNDTNQLGVLDKIKKRLREDTFTREYIFDILNQYPTLIKLCYVNFAIAHYIKPDVKQGLRPTLSYQRLQQDTYLSTEELIEKVKATVSNNHEFLVFRSLITFNQHVLKTNFFQPTKVAISFRMEPSFLPEIEYPNKLYGMIFVIGSEFRGFHLRFSDIARGGIRIVRSQNKEAYGINCKSLFDENYNLALTQERKNKDIPEGGAKGTILLDADRQDRAIFAFEKYVDSIIDLLLPGKSPGIKEKIVDLYGKEEILFFGPDEGTADLMNWASDHARSRGAPFWKAFTTGKAPSKGGIPHDTYGMTTRSVHQYVLGIFRKLNIKEETITKFQTGGPDGDLGSNEIKISHDKTISIVDGSGVICDPEGLNKQELLRLASGRKMIKEFDVSKLGKNGFRVLITDKSVTLPDGTVVDKCLDFRNLFHLHPASSADLFVPCGGRPEAVNMHNVDKLFIDGKPRFKYVVEGANLFFTQTARLHLEKNGVVVFKDASANKGGVTSSSLEVLAALSLSDEEFLEHMCVKDEAHPPAFFQEYVKAVQSTIEDNARMEFEAIWAENQKTGTPNCILTDQLSQSILKMVDALESSDFMKNEALRQKVLTLAIPSVLMNKVGYENLIKRVPENYLKAIFATYLSSRFVYKYGINPSQFAFFEFMSEFKL